MSRTKKYSIKTDFNLVSLLLIPVAVAINFAGGQLATLLKLPLYLDTIGTIFVAMLCGPWVGGVAGLVTNLVLGITNPVFIPFAIVNVTVGIVTGFCARANWFSTWWKWIISMVLMALASLITAAPIVVLMFGGVTGSGTSLITATLMATGQNIWGAVLSTELVFTVLDRIISFFVTWLIIRVIPNRTLIKFPCGENYIKDGKKAIVDEETEEVMEEVVDDLTSPEE
jgi:energy-coupling factor transport system substrate-specific component